MCQCNNRKNDVIVRLADVSHKQQLAMEEIVEALVVLTEEHEEMKKEIVKLREQINCTK